MCLYSNVYDTISLFRNKWEQKHRVPDTNYTNNDYTMKMLQSLWRFYGIRHDIKSAKRQKN